MSVEICAIDGNASLDRLDDVVELGEINRLLREGSSKHNIDFMKILKHNHLQLNPIIVRAELETKEDKHVISTTSCTQKTCGTWAFVPYASHATKSHTIHRECCAKILEKARPNYCHLEKFIEYHRNEMFEELNETALPSVLRQEIAEYCFGKKTASLHPSLQAKLWEIFSQNGLFGYYDLRQLMWQNEDYITNYLQKYFSTLSRVLKYVYCAISIVNVSPPILSLVGVFSCPERAAQALSVTPRLIKFKKHYHVLSAKKIVKVRADGGIISFESDEAEAEQTTETPCHMYCVITADKKLQLFLNKEAAEKHASLNTIMKVGNSECVKYMEYIYSGQLNTPFSEWKPVV